MSGLKLGLHWDLATDAIVEKAFASTSWVLVSGVLATVANGQLDPTMKARLVFWKFKNPLPGCEAFSRWMEQDARIDPSILRDLYGALPIDADEQNRLWYKIYKKHIEKTSIGDVHRKFLLTRDLTAISFLSLCLFSMIGYPTLGHLKAYLGFVSALSLLFFVFSRLARTYEESFVRNVLAEESSL